MFGSQATAEVIQGQIILLLESFTDELPRLVIQRWLPAASVRQGIGRTGFAVATQEVLDRGEADAKQVGDFGQGVFAAFVSFDDAAAEVIRVCFHRSMVAVLRLNTIEIRSRAVIKWE